MNKRNQNAILKLAETNWQATVAQRQLIAARECGDTDAIESALSAVRTTRAEYDHVVGLPSTEKALDSYADNAEAMRDLLYANAYDGAIMDLL